MSLTCAKARTLPVFLLDVFQPHVTKNSLLEILDGAVILGVGSNAGHISLPLPGRLPSAIVHAFEPAIHAVENFIKNLSLKPEFSERVALNRSCVTKSPASRVPVKLFASRKISTLAGESGHKYHLGVMCVPIPGQGGIS